MSGFDLHVQLECELPDELSIGLGTALFVCGWCFCPQARIRSLELIVGSERQPTMACGMPRLDPFKALHPGLDPFTAALIAADPESAEDPLLHSYRSGFWGLAIITAQPAGGELRLALGALLEGGGEASAELASFRCVPAIEPARVECPAPALGPPVAICMATYEPPRELLERQLETIRSQTHRNWVCLISDDCSSPHGQAVLAAAIGDDERFVVSRSPRRLGFYQNFERSLAMAPRDVAYVAMADQDDAWHPEKLETLLAGIGIAQLVYSDARVVARDGRLISNTWWDRRRNNHSSMLSLLVANAVTGAASLLRRDLLDYALPFPPAQFAHFHDHWIGLVALARGKIEFLDRPLYDYVQHGDASLGHAAANQMVSLRDRFASRRSLHERVGLWRQSYFVDVCRLVQFASVLKLRCWEQMTPRKRRELGRFLGAERSLLALAGLGLRGARELLGTSETLGAEWMLFHALAWRRLVDLSARDRPTLRLRLDALPPPSLIQQPGRSAVDEPARVVADKIAPLRWAPSDAAPQRVNLLIPSIDLQHFFGGYIAKLNLARRLAQRGSRVRIVTVDPVGPLPAGWRRTVESFGGLEGLFDNIELVFGRESSGIELSASDSIIATTWWTAHVAADALRYVARDQFVYLIQEYEPFTFPMGTYAALASASYELPHFALFSSELLRGYFRAHGIGVYAAGVEAGDLASAAFENAITPVKPYSIDELRSRQSRRLLFYARPEPHAARNMFELGVLALSHALEEGAFTGGWELHGIGTVRQARRISLGGGASLELLPRSDQGSYAQLLREHDLGLALMYTPHPSLVPIEMAAAGMLTVTNSFENKTPEAMAAISSNLITAQPSVEAVADALRDGAASVSDLERRIAGSQVNWMTDWDHSFPDQLLEAMLGAFARPHASVL